MSAKLFFRLALISLLLTFPLISFAKRTEYGRINRVSKSFKAASPGQNETFVLSLVRSWYGIQAAYYNGAGNGHFGGQLELRDAGLIDNRIASGTYYGYNFSWLTNPGGPNFPATFSFAVKPVLYGKSGRKSFYIDQTCTIRVSSDGTPANQNSPVLETCTPTLVVENEQRQPAVMHTLASAQATYISTVGLGTYAGSLTALYEAGLINPALASGTYQDYAFQVFRITPTATNPALFYFRASPRVYGVSGFKSFYIDETGVLRGADHQGEPATAGDPPIIESAGGN